MSTQKQSPNAARRIEELQAFVKTVDHVKKLVGELDSNRAAKLSILNGLCSSIARELGHMRQRAMSANVGTLADVAGQLAMVAGRQGTGLAMKIRALNDGVASMAMQLDQALKSAREAPPEKGKPA